MLTAYGEPYTLRKVSTVLREGKQETSPKAHWRLNPYSTGESLHPEFFILSTCNFTQDFLRAYLINFFVSENMGRFLHISKMPL
jgi:hypothetical protein